MKSSKKVNSLFLDYFDSCRQNACLSLPDSFSLCSALVSVPCVFSLIDRPTGVEMFYPSLSLPSSSISHPITLWDTCEGCGWKVNERDRELRRSREHRRREREISFALAKNSAVQWTKEVCCGDGSSETVWNVLFIFFLLTMWAAVKMFSLFVVYSSIPVPTLTEPKKFLTVRLSSLLPEVAVVLLSKA